MAVSHPTPSHRCHQSQSRSTGTAPAWLLRITDGKVPRIALASRPSFCEKDSRRGVQKSSPDGAKVDDRRIWRRSPGPARSPPLCSFRLAEAVSSLSLRCSHKRISCRHPRLRSVWRECIHSVHWSLHRWAAGPAHSYGSASPHPSDRERCVPAEVLGQGLPTAASLLAVCTSPCRLTSSSSSGA